MNKTIICLLGISLFGFDMSYYGSTTAPVTVAGGMIKSKHADEIVLKYKRKDCPVCKGTGWYMSGDNIKKIECTYCELDKGSAISTLSTSNQNNCSNNVCPIKPKGK